MNLSAERERWLRRKVDPDIRELILALDASRAQAEVLYYAMPKPDVFFAGLRAMGWAEAQARALVDDYAAILAAYRKGLG